MELVRDSPRECPFYNHPGGVWVHYCWSAQFITVPWKDGALPEVSTTTLLWREGRDEEG